MRQACRESVECESSSVPRALSTETCTLPVAPLTSVYSLLMLNKLPCCLRLINTIRFLISVSVSVSRSTKKTCSYSSLVLSSHKLQNLDWLAISTCVYTQTYKYCDTMNYSEQEGVTGMKSVLRITSLKVLDVFLAPFIKLTRPELCS